jgi:tellurite resistance-related uncharacterized protein
LQLIHCFKKNLYFYCELICWNKSSAEIQIFHRDTASKGIFAKSTLLKNKSTVFTIGNRGDTLTSQLEAPIIVPHVQQKTKFPFEASFRSEQYALVDNACREHLFKRKIYSIKLWAKQCR